MEREEGDIFSKGNRKSLFLLKIKIKQKPSCPNKEYNAIFKNIHQNIRASLKSNQICIDQWLVKYYCILGKVWAKRGVDEQVRFAPNAVGSLGAAKPHKHFAIFTFIFTDTKLSYEYEHLFSMKTGNLMIN